MRVPLPNNGLPALGRLSRAESACTNEVFEQRVEENHLEAEALAYEKLGISVNLFAFSR